MTPIRLVIVGCMGRMGSRLVELGAGDARFSIVGAVSEAGDASIGKRIEETHRVARSGGVCVTTEPVACDVVIEFSGPAGTSRTADWCAAHGAALVSGTTGLSETEQTALRSAARSVPVLWSANMSVGANILMRAAARMASALGEAYEIEIVETHHNQKRDAPSGTARAIADSICAATGRDAGRDVVCGREGMTGPRARGEIGIHAIRMGDHVGEHVVHFSGEGESLSIGHRAHCRDTFVRGALLAAAWIVGRPAGMYSMRDVLGD